MQGFIAFVAFIDIATALRNYVERRNFMWSNQEFTDLKLIEGNFSWCRRLFLPYLRGSFLVCLWAGNVILSFMLELSIHWILISIGSRSWWNLWCEFHIRLCFSPSTQCDTLFPIYQASLSRVGDGWYASGKWTKWYNTYDDDRDHICTFYEWRIFFYNPKIHPSRKKASSMWIQKS